MRRLYVSYHTSNVLIYNCWLGNNRVVHIMANFCKDGLVMFHLVIEDSEGNRRKINDFPKDVEDVLIDFVKDMEN